MMSVVTLRTFCRLKRWPYIHLSSPTTLKSSVHLILSDIGLMDEIIEDHAREHVANPSLSDEERSKGVEELLEAIRRYSK